MSNFFKNLLSKQSAHGAGGSKDNSSSHAHAASAASTTSAPPTPSHSHSHAAATPSSASTPTTAAAATPTPTPPSPHSNAHSHANAHSNAQMLPSANHPLSPTNHGRNNSQQRASASASASSSTSQPSASFTSSSSKELMQTQAQAHPSSAVSSAMTSASTSSSKYLSKLKDYSLLMEFKKLKHQSPTGVYVMPSATSLRRWDGVIFLRRGYYRKGIFRFVIHLPANYPDAAPIVTFLSDVFHPLIKKDSGELDLSIQFPVWKPSEHYIIVLLVYMKRIFYKPEIWEKKFASKEKQAFNLLAYTMWHRDKISYARKCEQCCMKSLDMMYKNPVESSLRLGKPVAAHEEVYRRIVSQDDILDTDNHDADNQINYLSWFVDGVHKLNSSIDSVLTRNSAPSAQTLPPV